jgi:hypothetical protein
LPLLDYQPDIVAELLDGRTIIGEAKTNNDILSTHSKEQYIAFISYLSQQSVKGTFLLFCSWKVAVSAKGWLRNFFRKHAETNVGSAVVSDIDIVRLINGSKN